VGGFHAGATGNVVSILAISPNVFESNFQDTQTVVDMDGATGNRIEYTSRRRTARH
jgi:hypothetical protein